MASVDSLVVGDLHRDVNLSASLQPLTLRVERQSCFTTGKANVDASAKRGSRKCLPWQ